MPRPRTPWVEQTSRRRSETVGSIVSEITKYASTWADASNLLVEARERLARQHGVEDVSVGVGEHCRQLLMHLRKL